MEMNNFANIINRLIHIIGIKAVSDTHLQNPKNLWMINNLHLKDFMNMKQTEIGFEFSFSLDNEVIYLIKKKDEQKEEPQRLRLCCRFGLDVLRQGHVRVRLVIKYAAQGHRSEMVGAFCFAQI